MMYSGKQIRMDRIIDKKTKKTVIVPMDHGITMGPIPGLQNVKTAIGEVVEGGANAVVVHKGLIGGGYPGSGSYTGLIIHMSASTIMSSFPNEKILVCDVKEAVKLGADAVSVHVNLGSKQEAVMLSDFGKVARDANEWGIPLLAMVYARGENIDNEFGLKEIKHAARLAAEIGADIVKVSYTGDPESFHEVVLNCSIPVVIAGGSTLGSDKAALEMVKGAIDAGAVGVSIGRNIFQHRNPKLMIQSISLIVHKAATVSEALAILK